MKLLDLREKRNFAASRRDCDDASHDIDIDKVEFLSFSQVYPFFPLVHYMQCKKQDSRSDFLLQNRLDFSCHSIQISSHDPDVQTRPAIFTTKQIHRRLLASCLSLHQGLQ
jgi:hypothetical protein